MTNEFYTSVYQRGNKIYVRGVKNGKSYVKEEIFEPTLYQSTKNPNPKFKGIMGEPLEEIRPGTIKECKNYIEQYSDVSNYKIHGNENWTAQYISDNYKGTIKYDPSLVRVFNLDIEVQSGLTFDEIGTFNFSDEGGFPHATEAKWPVTLIGIHDSITKRYRIFGYGNGGKDDYLKSKHFENIKNNGGQHNLNPDDIDYVRCDDEVAMLIEFLNYWSGNCPDIYTGWNTEKFDTPYLINRITDKLGKTNVNRLSPHGFISGREMEDKYGNVYTKFNIAGVGQIDYLELYRKFTYSEKESYKLDFIATTELGDGKLSYEETGSLKKLFKTDYQKYTEYNAVDILCVQRIDDKLKFIDILLTIAYYAKINYEDVLGTVKAWDSIIYNHLREQNIVVPPFVKQEKTRQFAGAYVKSPKTGKLEWITAFDLRSMYPHLYMQYNLGVDTLVPFEDLPLELQEWRSTIYMYDFDSDGEAVIEGPRGRLAWMKRLTDMSIDLSLAKKYNLTFAANGEFFRKDKKSFMNVLMDLNYNRRSVEKEKMLRNEQELIWLEENYCPSEQAAIDNRDLDGLNSKFFFESGLSESERKSRIITTGNEVTRLHGWQMALKILLNSNYGAGGCTYFRYYDLRVAEAVTMSGQVNITYIASHLSDEVNRITKTDKSNDRVVYIDTDSNYVDCSGLVEQYKGKYNQKYGEVPTPDKITDWLSNTAKNHFIPFINKRYSIFADYQNAYESKMVMSREVIAETAMWIQKKRYIMKILDSEGVRFAKPKYKAMGMDSIKSSTPEVCRDKLKNVYKVILDGGEEEIQKYIADFREEHSKLPAHMIAKNISMNGLKKNSCPTNVYLKAAPWHVRSALLYNHRIRSNPNMSHIEEVMEGEKVKIIALKEPNLLKYKTMAFPQFLDSDLGMDSFIDYKTMFEKTFIKPLQPMLDQLGWKSKKVGSLMGMFALGRKM